MGKFKTKHIVRIIGYILVFLSGIVVVIIQQRCSMRSEKPQELNLVITLRDADTGERIEGYVYINNASFGIFIDSVETPPNIPLAQGRYDILVRSDGYIEKETSIERIAGPITITLRKEHDPPDPRFPQPLVGWNPWGRLCLL